MTTQLQLDRADVLSEIFLKPSNEVKANRFSDSEVAGCTGKCDTGMCHTMTS